MAGKYAHIINKLPRYFGQDPGRQTKIDAIKESIARDPNFKRTAISLAQEYAQLRLQRDPLKEKLSELQIQIDAIEQLMAEQYEVEGTSSIRLSDIGSVRIQWEPYAKVVDKEKHRLWCLSNGYERDMSLLWMKTNSLLKEILLAGEKEPDGIEAKALLKSVFDKE